jgi:glucose-6-phosphate 1-epimerase
VSIIDTGTLRRRVVLATSGFADTVVWNPWIEKAKALADFGDEEYRSMLCVEPANAALFLEGNAIVVAAGASWAAHQTIHVESL